MSILPLRGLGSVGVITDIKPYDLPSTALSMSNNIRFDNGRIKRAPAFKSILNTTYATPAFSFTYATPSNQDKLGVVNITGETTLVSNGVETDVTPAGWAPISSTEPFTFCNLAGVGYLNRNTSTPTYYGPASTQFANLPNWPAGMTCRVLRGFKNFLIALNVTKSGVLNKTLVKWSDITLLNNYPPSWDETSTTRLAGENPLEEMPTQILDGLALRDAFVIYSKTQTHLMEYTADQQVFRFRKIFDNNGIINTNCCTEILGSHYVFGNDDIYQHDGISYRSIIQGKNRDYVFENLNNAQTDKFYVLHNPKLTEVMFCYISGDAETNFKNTTYCNKAAVYNYINGTWSFRDLPNASSASLAAVSYATTTWATTTATWTSIGGSWYSLSDNNFKNLYFVSPIDTADGLSASRVYGYDKFYGGNLTQAINTEASKTAWAERIGIDLDETGEQLRAYKVVRTIYPQATSLGGTSNIMFAFGATETVDQTPTFGTYTNFDPTSQEKVDVSRVGGRYLAWRVQDPSMFGFELAGFDVDVQTTGRR